ncbi:MAG: hypothetical protein LQ346_000928 [Caloplaca aetnensis]|nr:MAG: hypothetical protein LQ346_000928 [Caloplaca aetnensis]
MPRTIPWLKQSSSKSKPSAALPPKRVRPTSPSPHTSDDERAAQRAHARQRREAARQAANQGRTPSTSPPPLPPAIEPMRPGLSHDDIYIMVEDEFLSTAQLFTSHLHHAEYVRLKKLAQARSPSTNSSLGHLQRPTDSITTMRAETLKKKQAEAKAGKNKLALEQMKRDARGGIAVSDHSDDLSDSDADTAPWAGTSLQGLMAPDARRQNLTSLSGLHAIKSSTRAAKGYDMQVDASPGRNRQNQNQNRQRQVDVKTAASHPVPSAHSDVPTSSEDDDDDDLDAPMKRRPPPPPPPPRPPKSKTHFTSKGPAPAKTYNALTLAAEDLYQYTQSATKPTKPRPEPDLSPPSKHNRFESSPPSRDDTAAAVRKRIQARRERAAALEKKRREEKEEGGAGGNANVHEIPIFLV